MPTIKPDPAIAKIAKHAFPDYTGRKFAVAYVTYIDTSFNANWGGGSRVFYRFVRLDNGNILDVPDIAPWRRSSQDETAIIPVGCACVTRTIFQGKECGLTVFLSSHVYMDKVGGIKLLDGQPNLSCGGYLD